MGLCLWTECCAVRAVVNFLSTPLHPVCPCAATVQLNAFFHAAGTAMTEVLRRQDDEGSWGAGSFAGESESDQASLGVGASLRDV